MDLSLYHDKKHAQYINPQIPHFTLTDSHFYAFTSSQNAAKGNPQTTTRQFDKNKTPFQQSQTTDFCKEFI